MLSKAIVKTNMALSDFLSTTDANNQKQYYDQDVVFTTSSSNITTHNVSYSLPGVPDVRVWCKPTLIQGWKPLTDLQLTDSSLNTFETIRGQTGIDTLNKDIVVYLRPTSSPASVTLRVRIYYND